MDKELQQEFWNKFLAQAKPKIKAFQNISPIKRCNLITSSGIPSAKFNVAINNKAAKVELTIYLGDKGENKFVYNKLLEQKDALEAKFGNKFYWHNLKNNIHARIYHIKEINSLDKENWQKMIDFLIENYMKLEETFRDELARIEKM